MNPCSRPQRNAQATRERILQAATESFMEHNYEQVGLRSIATRAGVDAALISRYFGCKEELFVEVLASTRDDPEEVLGSGKEGFGERMVHAIFDPAREGPRMAFISLVGHSAASPVAGKLLQNYMEENFIQPLVNWLDEDGAERKAWLIVSILIGVVTLARMRPEQQKEQEVRLAAVLQGIVDSAV